jgi:hypothetical protein
MTAHRAHDRPPPGTFRRGRHSTESNRCAATHHQVPACCARSKLTHCRPLRSSRAPPTWLGERSS